LVKSLGEQLFNAARDNDTATVRGLLSVPDAQTFINYQDARELATPLHAAALNGNAAVLRQLIDARCSVDLQTKGGATPIFLAAENGHAAVTKQLIAARCNVEIQTLSMDGLEGIAPIFIAAGKGHARVTEQLIAARCDINVQTKDYLITPLQIALAEGHEAVAKQLLASRCNVDLQDKTGLTALQVAEHFGHAGIATLIRNKKQETPLLGRRVAINGLVAKPELNGRTGTAVTFNDDKGRYSVKLDEASFMIKSCNILPTVCRCM
jgi:ankyrin repeat protein